MIFVGNAGRGGYENDTRRVGEGRGEDMKFRFIDSSPTWYGIAKQLEYHLVKLGMEVSETEGITLCYANDIGSHTIGQAEPMIPANHFPLRRASTSFADILLCSQVACMKWFQRPHAYYLPSAVNTQLLYNHYVPRDIPVGFCGFALHQPRFDFLGVLSNAFLTDFRPALDGLFLDDLARYYSRCQIVVNDCQWTEVAMRVFEATACQACLVTKRVPGIEDLFEEDVEAVFYDDWPEMVDKITDLLRNIKKRARIAQAGMERAHRDHTYTRRAEVVKEIIEFSQGSYLRFGNSVVKSW